MILTSPVSVLIQIFISNPSGYWGAHIRICQSGTKYADSKSNADTAMIQRAYGLSFFMTLFLKVTPTPTSRGQGIQPVNYEINLITCRWLAFGFAG